MDGQWLAARTPRPILTHHREPLVNSDLGKRFRGRPTIYSHASLFSGSTNCAACPSHDRAFASVCQVQPSSDFTTELEEISIIQYSVSLYVVTNNLAPQRLVAII